jgi:tetratricopeptide (TPR) repeat protein
MDNKYFAYILSFIISASFIFSSYKEIDELQEKSMFDEALKLCESNFNSEDVEILWRLSRAYFDIADQTSDEEVQKINIDKALPFARSAIELNPLSARANHWYAVIIGKKGLLEGTKQKIINSYEVREFGLKAIELDPNYDGTYHLMGRWHYNIADLAWYERTIASAIYATPPNGSFDEAIIYFMKAMEANPVDIRHYLWLAKSYYQISNYKDSKAILEKALILDIKNDSDKLILDKINELYKKL